MVLGCSDGAASRIFLGPPSVQNVHLKFSICVYQILKIGVGGLLLDVKSA